jgi:hypothetical protein
VIESNYLFQANINMNTLSSIPPQILYTPPKRLRVESVRVQGRRPEFRVPAKNIASIVKDQLIVNRSLFTYTPLEEGHIRLIVVRRGKFDAPLECDLFSVPLLKGPQVYYEALSYEWGEGPPIYKVKLRDHTIDLRSKVQDRNPTDRKSQDEIDHRRLRSLVFRFAGANFFIRENLYQALRHLREEHREVTLWNDAICIDQSNGREKERQIAMMAYIYNGAHSVSIWLGDTSKKSDMAMEFVKEVVRFEQHHELFQNEDSAQK